MAHIQSSIVLAAPLLLAQMASPTSAAKPPVPAVSPWNLAQLSKVPQVYPCTDPKLQNNDVQAIFFEGLPWHGKPTRVFAYVGFPARKGNEKVPGIVLVHGGGGSAYAYWVRLWNSRGYAAIAFDTYGGTPGLVPGDDPLRFYSYHHDQGGPSDAFALEPAADTWPYHAVADTLLAHTLLRSYPQVDKSKTGITGVSWGGYLTCIAAGIDNRFKFAIPVYGCGFLGEDSAWLDDFKKMGPENAATWLRLWDPSQYVARANMPFLWVDGTNDLAFPLPSLQKTYQLRPAKQNTLATRVRMEHSHHGGENPPEIAAFADAVLKRGVALTRITGQGRRGDIVTVQYRSQRTVIRAELNYTTDSGPWLNREWKTVPAQLDGARQRATVTLPLGTTTYYVNLTDDQGLIVSSSHIEVELQPG